MSQLTGSLRLQNLAHAYKQAGALKAAIELDLFTAVTHGAREISQIAEKIGLSRQNAQKLVDVCSSLGLLEYKDGLYYNAPDVERHLVKGERGYLGSWLAAGEGAFNLWSGIAHILKGDKPPVAKGTYEEAWKDVKAARRMNRGTYNIGIGAGYRLARSFDFSPYSLLLDLGGGSGAYSIAIASTYPKMKAIVFDFPNVCKVAEEFIAQGGVSDRVKTQPGDFYYDELPRGADLISYITPLQSYGKDEVQFLINKAFDAVKPGGGIIILDYMLSDDKTGPMEPAFVHLAGGISQTNPGRVNTGAEFREYLSKAGFADIEVSDFVPGHIGKVIAKKPG